MYLGRLGAPLGQWETTEPEVEAEVIKFVNDPENTKEEKIAFVKSKHGEGLSNPDTNMYLGRLGAPLGQWETTEPEIEAKVSKYVHKTGPTIDEKAAFIEKYHGFGLGTDRYNYYMGLIGRPGLPKGGKSPFDTSDPALLMQALRMIFDDEYNLPFTEDFLLDNMGPDPETGEPRISPQDVKSLVPFARTHEKSPAYVRALGDLEQARKDGILNSADYVAIMEEFRREVNQGDLTEDGIVQQMKNLLMEHSEEFAEDVLDEASEYRWPWRKKKREEELERYFREHEPETRYEGTPRHFTDWMMTEPGEVESQYYPEQMLWAHIYDNRIYAFFDGSWHYLNEDMTGWIPYTRPRE
jgi:hypothetical protein